MQNTTVVAPFARVDLLEKVNPEFDRVKIWAFAYGKNRNMSYVSKEELDKAIPSLSYLPVVGHLIEDYDDQGNVTGRHFGGHDYTVTDDLVVKPLTVPFGVVIDNTAKYEDVEEWGQTVHYLTVEAYLWTGRWPELLEAAHDETVWFNESAELTFEQFRPYEQDSQFTELLGINFSALCILGKSDDPEKNVEPCFINAQIKPSQFSLSDGNFSQLMSELREQLALCFASTEKGGSAMDQQTIQDIFAQFELQPDAVDFSITDDMTEEQLRERCEQYVAQHSAATPAEEPAPAEEPVAGAAGFSSTYRERREMLSQLCESLNVTQENAEHQVVDAVYCYLCDFDDEHVFYSFEHWTPENYESGMRRRAYSIGEDRSAQFTGEPVAIFQKWLTLEEIQKLDADKAQLESLVRFKQETEAAQYTEHVQELFARFEDVSSCEEFETLRTEALQSQADLELCEMKLFALRGKQVKFSQKPTGNSVKIGIDPDEKPEDDGYGGLVSRARDRHNR